MSIERIQKKTKEESSLPSVPLMNFDTYFRHLLIKKPGVLPHHKVPMKHFAMSALGGDVEIKEEEFEKLFKNY